MSAINIDKLNNVKCLPLFLQFEEPSKEPSSIKEPRVQSPVIRVKDAHRYIGVSKSTYQNFKNSKSPYYKEDFPATVSIGDNAKGHYLADIDAWLHSRNLRSNFKRAGGAK